MGKALTVYFEIISVITARCKCFVLQGYNFEYLIVRRIFLGSVDAYPPLLAVFSEARSKYLASNLHKEVFYSVCSNKHCNLINSISLCNGGKIEGYGSFSF